MCVWRGGGRVIELKMAGFRKVSALLFFFFLQKIFFIINKYNFK